MPTAGFCSICGREVWIAADGSCQFGHAAEFVSGVRQAEPAPPPSEDASVRPTEDASATPPDVRSPRRRWIAVLAAAALGVLVLGACAGAIATQAVPLMRQGTESSAAVKRMVARDYPGWEVVGFTVNTVSCEGSTTVAYTFDLLPPDRDFTVGVVYRAEDGADPVCAESVLREGSEYHDRAEPLLDALHEYYASEGRRIVSIEDSEYVDSMVVTYEEVTQFLFFTSTYGDYELLTYSQERKVWDYPISSGLL